MSLRDKAWFPIAYMFVVTCFFSGILIAMDSATRVRRQRNERIFRERAVLMSLRLADDATPPAEVARLYAERIGIDLPAANEEVRQYAGAMPLRDEAGEVTAYAVPISGRGFWDVIRGFVGVQADLEHVIGVAFYQQSETPGLGARITEPEFRDEFEREGFRLAGEGERPIPFEPPGAALDETGVHTLTGATQTSVRVERFLNETLEAWLAEMRKPEAQRKIPPIILDAAPPRTYDIQQPVR